MLKKVFNNFRIIASGVRRISRSFYGNNSDSSGHHSHRRPGSFADFSGSIGTSRTHHPVTSGHHPVTSGFPSSLSQVSSPPSGLSGGHRKLSHLVRMGQAQSEGDLTADVTSGGNRILSKKIEESKKEELQQATSLPSTPGGSSSPSTSGSVPISKKISRITLRKLKIW